MTRRRYQQGSLQRVKNKNRPDSWRIVYSVDYIDKDGVLRRKRNAQTFGTVVDFPTEALARRVADAILLKEGINSIDYRPSRQASISEIIALYKKEIFPMLKDSTRLSYKSCLDHYIIPSLGHIRVDCLNNYLIQSSIKDWADQGLGQKTVKNILMVFSAIYKVAKDWGFKLGSFDHGAIKLPRKKAITRTSTFTPEQARHIIHASPYPYNILAITAALTGLRLGEILGLTWRALDFREHKIHITQTIWQRKVQTPKTDNSVRVIPLPEGLASVLAQYKADWTPNKYDLLWATEAGSPLCADNLRQRVLKPILEEMGIQCRVGYHAFRHMHGTLLVSVGSNAKVAQTQLGHSNLKTTMDFYVEALSEDHREAVERVSALLTLDGTILRNQNKKSQQGSNPTGSSDESK